MARATLSVLLDNLTGSAGTITFYSRRGQTRIRARNKPTQPNTADQIQARQRMAAAAKAWLQLTPTQVLAWEDFAPDGQTGNTVFVGLATKFFQIASFSGTSPDFPQSPPSPPYSPTRLTIAVTPGAGQIELRATASNPAGTSTEVLIQPLLSPHRTPNPRNYKTRAFIDLVANQNTPADLAPGTYAIATRQVRRATGESAPLLPAGIVTVSA
jgi:hypothetical protein